jgi:dipeptidyl aminopeptidase/acylaminoacyl peptidase
MTLATGTRLGPYEILSPLGAGGMGEVYRAKDTRLGREIAVKVLPEDLASDRERLARFEQEARAASALNHPNILTVYDIGSEEGRSYIAMELVEGKSLREILDSGPLPLRKGLDLAAQIADGLAKAHSAGIVHRDLKPENVMLSKDGFAKILDFGLAKLAPTTREDLSSLPTSAPETTPGVVLGTVGYMSPEQAAGRPVDYRSDQFSFGAIGYEMATGKKPFSRNTSAETLTAIIREEPEAIGELNPKVPAPVRWIVDRCLAKDPEDRYASTKDLARDLKSVKEHLSEASVSEMTAAVEAPRRRRNALPLAAAAAALVVALAAAYLAGRAGARVPQPKFQRLTFQRGTVMAARFAPDAQTVVYSAAWEGHRPRVFSLRPGTPETTALALPDANLLAVSSSGELAIALSPASASVGFSITGTLARVPLAGGAPKEILNDVTYADWAPAGELAVVHRAAGQDRLEFPIGKVLDQTAGWFQDPRFSPDGRQIAYLDHPSSGDYGGVAIVDLAGHKKTLTSGYATIQGLAWSSNGREIWFTAAREGIERELYGVSPSGTLRLIRTMQGTPALFDVSGKGGAIISEDDYRAGTLFFGGGNAPPTDLSWFDWQSARGLSPDGKTLLFDETGEGGGPEASVFVRKTDGSPAVRLGSGASLALSPDAQWALTRSLAEPSFTTLVPIGPGQPVKYPPDGLSGYSATFLPDGRSFVFEANALGHGTRLYLQDVQGGPPRPISAEDLAPSGILCSPDGKQIAAVGGDSHIHLYPVSGGAPIEIASSRAGDSPSGFSADGRSLYVSRQGVPCELDRIELETGRREKLRDLGIADAGGVVGMGPARVTPDGKIAIVGYNRILSTLYRVQGLQ